MELDRLLARLLDEREWDLFEAFELLLLRLDLLDLERESDLFDCRFPDLFVGDRPLIESVSIFSTTWIRLRDSKKGISFSFASSE